MPPSPDVEKQTRVATTTLANALYLLKLARTIKRIARYDGQTCPEFKFQLEPQSDVNPNNHHFWFEKLRLTGTNESRRMNLIKDKNSKARRESFIWILLKKQVKKKKNNRGSAKKSSGFFDKEACKILERSKENASIINGLLKIHK